MNDDDADDGVGLGADDDNNGGYDNGDDMTDIVQEHKEENWEKEPQSAHRCKCQLRDALSQRVSDQVLSPSESLTFYSSPGLSFLTSPPTSFCWALPKAVSGLEHSKKSK